MHWTFLFFQFIFVNGQSGTTCYSGTFGLAAVSVDGAFVGETYDLHGQKLDYNKEGRNAVFGLL